MKCIKYIYNSFNKPFESDDILLGNNRKTKSKRERKFSSSSFFMTVARLTSTDSLDGVQIILNQIFGEELSKSTPSDSAFSDYRATISYKFFKKSFDKLQKFAIEVLPRWNGLQFIAIDGDIYSIPRTTEMIELNFKGHKIDEKTETYALEMFVVQATDAISCAPIAFEYSNSCNEIEAAAKIIKSLAKKKRVFLFDRLYLCTELIKLIEEHKYYAIFRLKNDKTFKEVTDFMNSSHNKAYVKIRGVNFRLFKTWISEHESPVAVATNVPEYLLSDELLGETYCRRWASETSNRDATVFGALDHFHAKSFNGILQEIYASLWLRLSTALIIAEEKDLSQDFLDEEYNRPCYKQVSRSLSMQLHKFVIKGLKAIKNVFGKLISIINNSMEKRKRRSRGNKREVRYRYRKHYPSKISQII